MKRYKRLEIETNLSDPVFWLHHGQIDRLWWQWQSDDLLNRLEDYGGPTSLASPVFDAELQNMVLVLGLDEDTPVGGIMNIMSGMYCYNYVE